MALLLAPDASAHRSPPIQLKRASSAELADLVARHQAGVDVRAALGSTLSKMLPHDLFWTTGRDGSRRRVDRMPVFTTEAVIRDRFRLLISNPGTFRASPVGFGTGASSHHGTFYLPAEGGSASGTRITRLTYDGTRLRVKLLRDRTTMADDLSSRYQELELALDGSGRATSLTLWNYDRPWQRGTTIDATLPAEIKVWQASEDLDGWTVFQ